MSYYKSQLDDIEKSVYSFLKPQGFKKKGRTFNRQAEKGIYQVINFQSGQFPIGDNYVIPGVRENFYGKFTVNMGVCVEQIHNLSFPSKPQIFFQEYYCQIRLRLSNLIRNQDFWWALETSSRQISEEIINGLSSKGLNWLERFDTKEKIIRPLRIII